MNLDILRKLESYKKPYLTIGDLEKILAAKRASLRVKLSRMVKSGILVRLRKGAYALATRPVEEDKIATQLFQPSYVSFEFALARYGITGQIPYTVTLASPRLCLKTRLGNTAVEIRKLKRRLFFGYTMDNGVLIATPEKALLDMLYVVALGKSGFDLTEIDLKKVSKKKAMGLAKNYPRSTQKILRKLFSAGTRD